MRAVAALLVLALWAEAQDLVVRVTVGDEPAEGAGVQVQPMRSEGPTFRADKFAPDARTDATGQALVQATAEDQVLIYFPGCGLAVVDGGGQVADVDLRPERVFSGRVVDSKGEPVVGATVILRTTFRRKAAFPVTSGQEGKFHVYGLWFDDYALWIEADGFVPWLPRAVSVTEQDRGRTYVLKRVGTIAGTVTDHRGKPVARAEVRLSGRLTTWTADDGTYRISDIEPEIEHEVGFPPPWGGEAGPITVHEGEVREGVDVVRLLPVTLRLRVVDAEGRGLAGVTAQPSVSGLDKAASNAKGVIELPVPPKRPCELWLRGADVANETIQVAALPSGVQDLGDVFLRPVPEVEVIEVRVRLPDGTAPAKGTVGSVPLVDGVAHVEGTGEYEIDVPGHPAVFPDIRPPGPVLVTLPTPQWIEGIVLDGEGAPVVAARVTTAAGETNVEPVESDSDGRFRIGPFAEGPVEVSAETATARSRSVEVILGDAELELIVLPTKSDLIRGRVLRGVQPVTRFKVEGQKFVDEEGRFEVLLPRAEKDWIGIHTDSGSFPFALPPEGQELIARLPGGRVAVTLEGAVARREVSLSSVGSRGGWSATTRQDGIARFADLEPGIYAAEAEGFATTEFPIVAGVEQLVTLAATPQGSLIVRAPAGFLCVGDLRQTLNPGVHRDVFFAVGTYGIAVDAVRIVAGQETIVDPAPANGGSLLVRGRPGESVRLRLRQADFTLDLTAELPQKDGEFRFPALPPGSYSVKAPLRRAQVEIGSGDAAVLELRAAGHVVEDRVLLWNGKPAQGVEVRLSRAGDVDRKPRLVADLPDGNHNREGSALTDLRGRFRFRNVFPGEYRCVAELAGYAPASGTVTVGIDGTVTDGLPLTLERSAGRHARVLGLVGEPLRNVELRVNGRWQDTDALGRLLLHAVPSRIDLDLEGLASIRDLEVHADDEIRLVRGATLVVFSDPETGPPTVRVGGRPWRRLRPAPLADDPVPGRLVLEDLPPGPVEIQLPAPPAAEVPEPFIAQLESGGETTVDLRPR